MGTNTDHFDDLSAGVRLKSISEEDIFEALSHVINDPHYKVGAAKFRI